MGAIHIDMTDLNEASDVLLIEHTNAASVRQFHRSISSSFHLLRASAIQRLQPVSQSPPMHSSTNGDQISSISSSTYTSK